MTEYITEWYLDERRNAPNQAQREEIVRCRDCKHYGLGRRCGWSKRFVTPDGFCAWGERRTNDN